MSNYPDGAEWDMSAPYNWSLEEAETEEEIEEEEIE